MSHANEWCRQCNNSPCWAGTHNLGCTETSHKLEGNVGHERMCGWKPSSDELVAGMQLQVTVMERSSQFWALEDSMVLYTVQMRKLAQKGDVKGENPREHNCQTWTELRSGSRTTGWVSLQALLALLPRLWEGTLISCGPCHNFGSTGLAVVR